MVLFGIYLTILKDFVIEEDTGYVPSTGFEPVAYGLEIRCNMPFFSSIKLGSEMLMPRIIAPNEHYKYIDISCLTQY